MKDNQYRAKTLRKVYQMLTWGISANNSWSVVSSDEMRELVLMAEELEASIPEVTPQMEADWDKLREVEDAEWVEPKKQSGG